MKPDGEGEVEVVVDESGNIVTRITRDGDEPIELDRVEPGDDFAPKEA